MLRILHDTFEDLHVLEMRPRLMLAVAGRWVGSAGATIDGPAGGDNQLDVAAAETSSHKRK